MKVMIDWDGYEPIRAHTTDAGLDLRAKHGGIVPAHDAMTFGTGVHIQLPPATAGLLLPKSGLMVKHNLLTFGVVDETYRGEIMIQVFNLGDEDYVVEPGDKISQLLISPVMYEGVELVRELDEGERGNAGFGSTGR